MGTSGATPETDHLVVARHCVAQPPRTFGALQRATLLLGSGCVGLAADAETNKRAGHSFVELLSIIAIVAMMFSVVGKVFVDGWTGSRRAVIQAENGQLVTILMKRWQKELRETKPDEWRVDEKVFHAGAHGIVREGDRLVFRDGDSSRAVHLPKGVECAFSIERNGELADCAALTLNLPSWRFNAVRTNTVRIVACGCATDPHLAHLP